MCSICGSEENIVKHICKETKHRGPDYTGYFQDGFYLGHNRLAIIDLNKRSNQPFVYEHKEKQVVIVFNGEIYNYKKIKKELEIKGYRFRTNSDTEVLGALYIDKEKEMVKYLDGMFAFVIYDRDKIFFARDIAGEKPFYYLLNPFSFSSEIKGLVGIKKLTIDRIAIGNYLSFGFIPAPRTIYTEIKKLPSGHYGIYWLKNKRLEIKEYRKLPNKTKITDKKLENIIKESIKTRLIADVPIGIILSAGLDSSTVAYYTSKYIKNITAYSISFDEKDESLIAERFAKELDINFRRIYFGKEQFFKLINEVAYIYDEPHADHSAYPSLLLFKEAKKDMTVAVSGDGGDEIFGGYLTYQKAYILELLKKMKIDVLWPIITRINKDIGEALKEPLENYKSLDRGYNRYMDKRSKELSRKILKKLMSRYEFVEALMKYDYLFNNLPDNFLTKTDRSSMRWALELRSPFLSKRLWEISPSIPITKKIIPKTKQILRNLMKNKLPNYILNRKKQGFGAPIGKWLIEEQIAEEYFDSLIKRKEINEHKKFLEYIITKTKNKKLIGNSMQYRVFGLELWFRRWVNEKDKSIL